MSGATTLWILALATVLTTSTVHGGVIVEPASGSLSATVGENVQLKCQDPDGGELEWVMDSPFGEIIIEDNPPFVLTAVQNDGSMLYLSIEGVQVEDSADYTCRSVDNPGDKQVVTLTIHEEGAAPPAGWVVPVIEVEGKETIEVEVGKELRLKCEGGNKNSDLVFLHDGDFIVEDTKNIITGAIVQDVSVLLLTRDNADMSYSGTYTCHDANFPDISDDVQVDVIEHPSTRVEIIEPSGTHTKVMNGENFNLKCQSSLQTTIKWYHGDDELVDQSEGFIVGTSENTEAQTRTSVLTKEGAEYGDSGSYRCVNADSPQDEASIEVDVRAPEQDAISGATPVERRNVIMKVGSTVNLECSFEAPGEYKPEWSKNDQLLCAGPKYAINAEHQTTSLIIKYAERYDAGIYKCEFKHIHTGHIAGILIFNVTALRCPSINPPDFGSFEVCARQPLHGDTCSFMCHPHYKLTDSRPLICDQINGLTFWAGHMPKCKRIPQEEVEANMPMSMSHVLLQVGWDQELRCTHPATWSKDGHRIHHGNKYHIRSGHLIIKNPNKLDAGDYDCYVRDTLSNHLIGIQKFNVTTLACPPLAPPPNGSVVQCSSRPVYGETCIFRCNPGLRLTVNRARTCVLSHSNTEVYWTGGQPRCVGPYSSKLKYTSGSVTRSRTYHLMPLLLLLLLLVNH